MLRKDPSSEELLDRVVKVVWILLKTYEDLHSGGVAERWPFCNKTNFRGRPYQKWLPAVKTVSVGVFHARRKI